MADFSQFRRSKNVEDRRGEPAAVNMARMGVATFSAPVGRLIDAASKTYERAIAPSQPTPLAVAAGIEDVIPAALAWRLRQAILARDGIEDKGELMLSNEKFVPAGDMDRRKIPFGFGG